MDKIHICDKCNLKFDNEELYEAHIAQNDHLNIFMVNENDTENIKSEESDEMTEEEADNYQEIDSTDDLPDWIKKFIEKLHKCLVCNVKFSTTEELKSHLETSRPTFKELFMCEFCPEKYIVESEMILHLKFEHPEEPPKKFRCDECNVAFYSSGELCDHNIGVHVPKYAWPHSCENCNKMFVTPGELICHVVSKKNQCKSIENYFCEPCDLTFSHPYFLECHKLYDHLVMKEFKCRKCNLIFKDFEKFESHDAKCSLLLENPENAVNLSVKCDQCEVIFDSFYRYLFHRRNFCKTVNKRDIFKCNKCNIRFGSSYSMTSHKLGHEQYQCDKCYVTFFNREVWESHTPQQCTIAQYAHTNKLHLHKEPTVPTSTVIVNIKDLMPEFNAEENVTNVPKNLNSEETTSNKMLNFKMGMKPSNTDYPYVCHLCAERFQTLSQLNQHIEYNGPLETLLVNCGVCGHFFENIKALQLHKIVEHPENKKEKFRCKLCSESFKSKNLIISHIGQIHTPIDQWPVSCRECGQKFLSKASRQCHALKNSSCHYSANNICNICDYQFPTLDVFRIHAKNVHRKAGRFECKSCDKVFGSYAYLENHKKDFKCSVCSMYVCTFDAFDSHKYYCVAIHCVSCKLIIRRDASIKQRDKLGRKCSNCQAEGSTSDDT